MLGGASAQLGWRAWVVFACVAGVRRVGVAWCSGGPSARARAVRVVLLRVKEEIRIRRAGGVDGTRARRMCLEVEPG